MFRIAVIVGSLREESFNRKLTLALDRLKHPTLQLSQIKIDDIPLYNQDLDDNLPKSVIRLKKEIADADAVLFVTPEYNRSIPGVLKNIIDWGTRPYGENVWAGKLMAAIGTSPGAIGTAVAQSHLRSIMVAIDGIYIGQPEIYLVYKDGLIDSNFSITVESTRNLLQGFLDRFAKEVEKYRSA
ncbi:NADPH-dependent FMN reductase [Legionella norrlandica]|uniref:NADPH-dependent FMN reductase n=1 Tax=Legionella norrlandica TaxID=1498499 RepID=A0A0A2SP09_9GAMM|nr:NADPH-dependent FMN reductase [Legionella norrlandica]KGP62492.1 NADPH-dependent FMN reductase [Legionella norrlandica]